MPPFGWQIPVLDILTAGPLCSMAAAGILIMEPSPIESAAMASMLFFMIVRPSIKAMILLGYTAFKARQPRVINDPETPENRPAPQR